MGSRLLTFAALVGLLVLLHVLVPSVSVFALFGDIPVWVIAIAAAIVIPRMFGMKSCCASWSCTAPKARAPLSDTAAS